MMQGYYVWSHMVHFGQYKSSVIPLNLTNTCRLNQRMVSRVRAAI